jgi:MATE family multidrug resistance protein
MKCICIGLPSSLAHTIEIFAWAVFFMMLTSVGKEHITVISVAQSIFFLFTFMTEGISKGATAIAANMIGAGKESSVWKLLSSGIRLYIVVFFALGIILVVNPAPLIHLFISPDDANGNVYQLIASSCIWVWLFFLFDGIHWLVVGLLTAAGDTKFVLKVGSTTIWLFALLPTYVLVVLLDYRADLAWAMTAFYGLVVCSIYLWRFQSESWKGISIT